MATMIICNLDDRSGALCYDGCSHPKIVYVPMAAGFRCDNCRTFERDRLDRAQMRQFHDAHARCEPRSAGLAARGSGQEVSGG